MYYFGCSNHRVGHYLWESGSDACEPVCPVGPIDTVYCPKNCNQKEGAAALVIKDGYTILAFWDRSKDTRHGSNAAFIERGTHTIGEMISLAKEKFPLIMQRFKFPIVLESAS